VRTRIAGLQQQLSDCERRGERFRLLIENATDYAFITFDAENRISSWNLGAERVLGYSESEMMGQNGDVLFTPEDRATGAAAQEFETARTEGRTTDERWHLRKDGSRFWASGVLMCLQPGQPANGNGQYSFGKLLRDLTERKEAEERLRQSEERFRLFLENVRDCALFQLDPHGNISVWNPGAERLFGYSEQEIVGECIKVLFPADELSQRSIDEELKRVLTYDRAEEEQWLIRKNGSRFFARWTTNLMRDDEGQIRGFVKVLRDETARKLQEDENEQLRTYEREALQSQVNAAGQMLDRTKEELQFLAATLILAHEDERRRISRELHDDISQRSAMLEIAMAMLQGDLPEQPDQIRAELQKLQRETASLSEHLRRISHRLHPAVLEDLGLEVAIRRLAEDFQPTRKAAVRCEIGQLPNTIPLQTASAVFRIAQEALRNIGKHAPEAAVTIELTAEGGELRLSIQDNGPGFDSGQVRGAGGIGLISMQERAYLAGGTLAIVSAPGRGACIEARVPLDRGRN
jgi:PAS domain S-box-containing protein